MTGVLKLCDTTTPSSGWRRGGGWGACTRQPLTGRDSHFENPCFMIVLDLAPKLSVAAYLGGWRETAGISCSCFAE